MNSCIFTGHITKDPEMMYSQQGMAITKFGLAVNDGWGDNKTVNFLNMVAFKKTAEAIANYTNKGSKVTVRCRVKTRSYEKKDGSGKVYTTDFVVDEIEFPSKKESQEQSKPQSNSFSDDEDIFQPVDESDMDSIPF